MKTFKKITAYMLLGSMLFVLSACNKASTGTGNEFADNKETPLVTDTSEEEVISEEEVSEEEIAPEDDDREKRLVKIIATGEDGLDEIYNEYAYDDEGRVISAIEYGGYLWKIKCSYDAQGRIEHITRDGNVQHSRLDLEFEYDEQGNVTVNANNGEGYGHISESFTLDEREDDNGNLLVDWGGDPYKYDANGRLLSHKHYTIDANDNFYKLKDVYSYDSNGNLLKIESFDGSNWLEKKIEYAYDEKGNIIMKKEEYGGWEPGIISYAEKYEYDYDEAGNMIGKKNYRYDYYHGKYMDEPEWEETYGYDSAGRKISESRKYSGKNEAEVTEYTYDESGNIISSSINGIKDSDCVYDKLGNPLYLIKYDENGNEVYRMEYIYELGENKVADIGKAAKELIWILTGTDVLYQPVPSSTLYTKPYNLTLE